MTLVTLRPNATLGTTSMAVIGSGTLHAALADNSDSSYAEASGSSIGGAVGFPSPSLPAGAVVRSQAIAVRTAKTGATDSLRFDALGPGPFAVVPIGALSPVTYHLVGMASPMDSPPVTGLNITALSVPAQPMRVYEAYLDVVYVIKPTVVVTYPTGTVTTTNVPFVDWTPSLDSDGGTVAQAQVRVFTAAQYGVGGFDPATSPATAESVSSDFGALPDVPAWQLTEPLANGTYRAYVRVAQSINGNLLWSDWASSGFVLNVTPPHEPALVLESQPGLGRIKLKITPFPAGVATSRIEAERSLDGVTWEPCRAEGSIPHSGDAYVWDFEAPNGVDVQYRVRASHNYSGVFAASAWMTGVARWTSADTWLKHPLQPGLNMKVTVKSTGPVKRTARQGVMQALGASAPIVVSDTRGPQTGSLVLLVDDDTVRDALDALLDTGGPLLLQAPPGGFHIPNDFYVSPGDHDRTPLIDHAWAPKTVETINWTRVAKPSGTLKYPAGIA